MRARRDVALTALKPAAKDKYPGTSGKTHGDRKETRPTKRAMGIAKKSEPSMMVLEKELIIRPTLYRVILAS